MEPVYNTGQRFGDITMSVKLEKALAKKQVLIRKIVSGEVVIHFFDKNIKDLVISHNGVMDLMSKRSITADSIRESNLKDLIREKIVEVL
jgi:hypothetical protein